MPTAPSAQISATLAMIVEAITRLGKGFIVFEIKTSKARPALINRPAMAAKSEAVHATDGVNRIAIQGMMRRPAPPNQTPTLQCPLRARV